MKVRAIPVWIALKPILAAATLAVYGAKVKSVRAIARDDRASARFI
jgi:hypothetical protein